MGTPEFAVPSLKRLVEGGKNVVGVITAVDKPKGRGRKLSMSPVKACALSHSIPVLQPANLKSPEFVEELRSYKADLHVVVAFRMLPEVVWSMPTFGTFNLHASLLPQYRGAAPINWAVINGEKETGLTTFFIKHEIDTGSIIFQEKEPIHEKDTVGDLYERMMIKGAELVMKTVEAIEDGNYKAKPQTSSESLQHAPKIFKEDCEINWALPTRQVYNFIRGLSPYPAARTQINGQAFKIFFAEPVSQPPQGAPGTYDTDNHSYWHINTQDGMLAIKDLQLEGRKRMTIEEFLKGHNL